MLGNLTAAGLGEVTELGSGLSRNVPILLVKRFWEIFSISRPHLLVNSIPDITLLLTSRSISSMMSISSCKRWNPLYRWRFWARVSLSERPRSSSVLERLWNSDAFSPSEPNASSLVKLLTSRNCGNAVGFVRKTLSIISGHVRSIAQFAAVNRTKGKVLEILGIGKSFSFLTRNRLPTIPGLPILTCGSTSSPSKGFDLFIASTLI